MTSWFRFTLLTTTGICAIAGSIGFATTGAFAQTQQTADRSDLEEVVVTARKKEERLLDTPISVTAFTAAQIEKAQLFDVRDIAVQSPGLTFQAIGGNGGGGRVAPVFYFRGLGYTAPLPAQQTGAVFVDGVYVLGGITSVNTVDVERVEVIKGPQNAQYGRNTFGGAINFITRNPGDEFKGEISAEVSNLGSNNVSLSAEGPVVPGKLGARISLMEYNKGAEYTANDGGKLGEENTKSVTGTLYATPSDNLWIRVRAHYQVDDDGAPDWGFLSGTGNTSCNGVTITGKTLAGVTQQYPISQQYFCGHIPSLGQLGTGVLSYTTSLTPAILAQLGNPNALVNAFVNNSLNNPFLAQVPKLDHQGLLRDTFRINGSSGYTFQNGITATLNLAYDQSLANAISNEGHTQYDVIFIDSPEIFRDYTAELRFASPQNQRFRWMAGTNYFRGDYDVNFNGSEKYLTRTLPTQPFSSVVVPNLPMDRDGARANVEAFFGSLDYDILKNLTITGELRYQWDHSRTDPNYGPTFAKVTFKDWLPRGILNYKPVPDWTLYASWSRGVLPGQYNSGYATATPYQASVIQAAIPGIQTVLPSQKVDSYEIGSKQKLFDNRVEYTAAVYYMKWSNLPSLSVLNTPTSASDPTPVTFPGLLSSGNANLYGVEFEGTVRFTHEWDADVKVGYQHAVYSQFLDTGPSALVSGLTNMSGHSVPRIPNVTGTLSSTYHDRLTANWNWFVRGDVNYTGSMWDSTANIVKTDAYARVNMHLGVEKDNLTIELFVKNMLDDKHWDYAVYYNSLGEAQQSFLVPEPSGVTFAKGLLLQAPDRREIGVRAKFNF